MKKLTAKGLVALASKGKCVTFKYWKKPMPVAFLQNMQFRVVMNFIKAGLYEYKKKP